MQSRVQGIRAWLAGAAATAMATVWALPALADEVLVGQPTPGAIGLQPGVTPLKHDAAFFHDVILLPIITVITLFVLALLVWVVVRYNKKANPTPAKWSHNTTIEVIWTVVPVLILMFIAIFSFRLLYAYHDMPKPYMTVKATGYQWYWGYEYPDNGISEFISNVLPEDKAKAKNVPYLLAATEPLVVPVGKPVRVIVTGADVIHAFAVPAFGIISDAVPGRLNETWFKVERPGVYYGNCRELCGVDHAYMPIEVHAVSQAEFDAWVASKGGYKVGAAPAPAPAPAAAPAPAVLPAAASDAAAPPSATPAPASAPTSN
ncbi:MAG: cytochrome c oxidase subunit II [Phenylobacterium sp.]|jgi:cytochrome c oxidase subunit 2|uniref:cytochrome c oxidase subunit II n=1 Tax=Phenylobacterium sp. TaxID=1871053 RepID=UPI0025EE18BD|nr:cytochrome c oxidase subunit II [Phenylobacterium sp.]MCA3712746.1 cytochrome c oxidase subunit II [Phenylobacterium sp.]MCA3727939.1 cytochrome c oxidase subunit II [Phenylobacterium sp.]MCA3737952.1 cytochrome c oxidase subunit II [Phenylobacterium sp.]MCA3749973.1 cytochrome c oxidase subunit II [Phenylobacterium sp.]MCA3753143.1 cytochrome c oxidase subunit II [Phenylobacterium sp.]